MEYIKNLFDSTFTNTVFIIFLIALIGYAIGGIKIKGISLGTAAVFLVALVFGHFGIEVPSIVQNMGLVLFTTAVGFIAGPKFFRNLKKNAKSYVLLGIIIILSSSLTCVGVIMLTGVDPAVCTGMLSGALTSTPGFAAAKEAVSASAELVSNVSVGYGVAYPFGVLGVVLFVQLIPRILKVDMAKEREQFTAADDVSVKKYSGKLISLDSIGFFGFVLAVVLGVFLGKIVIPLPGGASFSLGTSGGPLIAGLVLGHFSHIGRIDVSVKKPALEAMRELGLTLFLLGAGLEGGHGFVEILKEYGVMLFVYGALMTLVPLIIGFLFAKYVLKLNILNNLGSITGGMTSTPALGTLISVAGTDDVAAAYATTYPMALITVVLCAEFISIIFCH